MIPWLPHAEEEKLMTTSPYATFTWLVAIETHRIKRQVI
jgi:hypothetical protein